MKIAIVLYGAIRTNNEDLKKTLLMHYNMIDPKIHQVHFFITTFYPVVNPQFNFCNVIHEYNYDIEKLKIDLNSLNLNITYIFNEQPCLNTIMKTKNKSHTGSLFLLHYYNYFFQYIKIHKLEFDYIIRSRTDIYIDISNIDKYFINEIVSIPKHCHANSLCCISDFFIIPKKCYYKFYDIHDNTFIDIIRKSWDHEEMELLFADLLKNNTLLTYMDTPDIKYMKLHHHKWYIKNGKTHII
jgi:hypothetical protein